MQIIIPKFHFHNYLTNKIEPLLINHMQKELQFCNDEFKAFKGFLNLFEENIFSVLREELR
jgi:predicted N-acyltransferase